MRCIIFVLAMLVIELTTAVAQDTTTADGLFTAARQAAFDNKDYNTAIRLSKKALVIAPRYTDIVIFVGRVYAWTNQPDSSRIYMKTAVNQDDTLEDAYAAYSDLEYWNHNDDTALAIVQTGLGYHPTSEDLLLRKAKILNALREYKAALQVADTILIMDKGNSQARMLADLLRDYIAKNKLGIRYDYAYFDKQFPDPWQFVSMDYTRLTKAGPFIARINYANRFKTDGLQYQLEAYPRISRTLYAYGNISYSDDVGVFPHWYMGASLFANLPKAYEAEVGIRSIFFTSDILMYTVYVGKYYKSFLFGARTYLVPGGNISQAYSAMARYYFGGTDDFIGLTAGGGISPDDARINIQLNNTTYKLHSYNAELKFSHSIRRVNVVTLNAFLLNQEYLPNTTGNQLQVGVGYIRHF